MKRFFNIVLFICSGLTLGLSLGAICGREAGFSDGQTLIVIAGILAGVFAVGAIILSTVIARDEKHRKNLGVSYQKKDFILQAGETYTVQKRGKLRPGEYIVLATDESDKAFNIRVNDYVKEYKHNSVLVLADGDTVSARSGNVILR